MEVWLIYAIKNLLLPPASLLLALSGLFLAARGKRSGLRVVAAALSLLLLLSMPLLADYLAAAQ